MINFDEGNLTAGTVVTDQFEGLSISTPSEFGVMVFDTNNPTGGDDDLSADDLGNVLIISEDGDSSDPDDNATGGVINIEFDEPSTVTAIGLLDIEQRGFVRLLDEESNIIEFIDIEPMGDGESFELDISNSEVARLELGLAESGALTSLDFSPDNIENSTSTPAIQLTDTGWEQDGQQLGTWTGKSDFVIGFSGIEAADTVTANALRGDDLILSVVDSGRSLSNQGTILTGNGDDYVQGSVIGSGNDNVGIFNDFETEDDLFEFLNTVGTPNPQQVINTEAGEDRIIGTVEITRNGNFNQGIYNGDFSSINTGVDNDQIIGTVKVQENGDLNTGIASGRVFAAQIDTGAGDDQVAGTVEVQNGDINSGIFNSATVFTKTGNDQITGTTKVQGNGDGNVGLVNAEGFISAGDGDDRIIGTVEVGGNGSFNRGIVNGLSTINMGARDDYLYGVVEVAGDGNNNVGIYNDFSGTINMGSGDDLIVGKGGDAYTGFAADIDDSGTIELGEGNDRIVGFGANQFVNGGTGIDIAEFEFSFDDGVTLGSTGSSSIEITANEITMFFTDVEGFVFANGSFTVDELIDLV